jgi:hypothetical protein
MSKAERAAGPKWKPKVCADCPKRHPSFNLDGGKEGTPWRCARCNAKAEPMPVTDPFAGLPTADAGQGSLL